MIDLLEKSVEDVFRQTFGMEPFPCKSFPKGEGYEARIPVYDGTKEYAAYVWIQKPTLKKIAQTLLFEENPDEETLSDLVSETANFVVGHAKMIASDRKLSYRIETPVFEGKKSLNRRTTTLLWNVENRCMAVQIEAKDG